MITIKEYIRPKSLEEAYELNQKRNNRIIGGMLWIKMQRTPVNVAIDLGALGLDTIEETSEEFSIGAMVTLRQLEQHEGLNSYSDNAIKTAVQDIIGVQFRNMATIGGSIWGRFGFSDILTVFLAMDTYVELYKGGVISLREFSGMKYDNDILVRIIVKKKPCKVIYDAMRIQRTDYPVITCALSCIDGSYRAVIGARPGKAVVVEDTGILSEGITEDSAEAFASYVASNVRTSTNMRGSAAYRKHLIKGLTARNIMRIGGQI
ncbi:MAG: FAD binding domain-containing protein [Clostridiales bacterium]|nr:FAD binding domain-containing protein [Candidatus Crickella merdequi]